MSDTLSTKFPLEAVLSISQLPLPSSSCSKGPSREEGVICKLLLFRVQFNFNQTDPTDGELGFGPGIGDWIFETVAHMHTYASQVYWIHRR